MKFLINCCNFGTIYLWIFVLKVLEVSAEYQTDTATAARTLIMKPYPYQIFDDYTDELINERNVVTPTWQRIDKQLYLKRLPLNRAAAAAAASREQKTGNAMTSHGITFENLNDFGSYKIKNAIWPGEQHQHANVKDDSNFDDDINFEQQLRRHSLSHNNNNVEGVKGIVDAQRTLTNNILYKNGILPIILGGKRLIKDMQTTKKSMIFNNADGDVDIFNDAHKNNGEGVGGDVVKQENIFPFKTHDTLNANDVGISDGFSYGDDENDFTASSGNGNESLNYSDNNEANTNYILTQSDSVKNVNKNHDKKLTNVKPTITESYNLDKRAKPSYGHTPFLPAVSGGAMTNLGKFFRDLSKNVHFSEQYQWGAEDQKLLEGDANFSNIQHHLTKPKSATDKQTEEWIKAIRFYRPSQKIRSLVAMNPHGQWAHSSQFIDPNYMWVGLGK